MSAGPTVKDNSVLSSEFALLDCLGRLRNAMRKLLSDVEAVGCPDGLALLLELIGQTPADNGTSSNSAPLETRQLLVEILQRLPEYREVCRHQIERLDRLSGEVLGRMAKARG